MLPLHSPGLATCGYYLLQSMVKDFAGEDLENRLLQFFANRVAQFYE